MNRRLLLMSPCIVFALRTSGQTPPELVIDPVIQKDAPVQIVAIKQIGDNTVAPVKVKNATDRWVQDFTIIWTIFRPTNCAVNGPAPRIQRAIGEARQIYAKVPNPPSPPDSWGDRVFKPREQIEVTWLSLTRTSLLELAKKYNAKKLRVQVGIAYVNYTTGDKFTSRDGSPDWRDETVEKTSPLGQKTRPGRCPDLNQNSLPCARLW
jgi:hypothetical protein